MRFEVSFFRAKRSGDGTAAFAQFNQNEAYLQTGAQSGPMNDNGGAPFEVKDQARSITVKLGLPDLGALIATYRSVRLSNSVVPESLRSYSSDKSRDTSMSLGLVHKFNDQSKTITWAFTDKHSFIGISKPGLKQSVVLSVSDEVQLIAWAELALSKLIEFGTKKQQARMQSLQTGV